MSQTADPAHALRQRPVLRESWLQILREQADLDPRIKAVWIVGSLASEDSDDWSDVDLIVACDPELLQQRRTLARALGTVLLEWDAPQNAGKGAMHYCTVYDLGSLPFGVDWHFWPDGSEKPSDAKTMLEGVASKASSLSFEELQKLATAENKNRTIPEMPEEERRQFRVSMLYPICKDLARGWPQSSAVMMEWLGFEAPEQTIEGWLSGLGSMLQSLADEFPAKVKVKYETLLLVTEWALRQQAEGAQRTEAE